MDLSLAKAEPVSDIAGTSVKTYLRKGKKNFTAAVREDSENLRETAHF